MGAFISPCTFEDASFLALIANHLVPLHNQLVGGIPRYSVHPLLWPIRFFRRPPRCFRVASTYWLEVDLAGVSEGLIYQRSLVFVSI